METTTSPLDTLASNLAVTFAIITLGYVSATTGFVPKAAAPFLGALVGKVALPLLVFRSIANISLASVDLGVVGVVGVVKMV